MLLGDVSQNTGRLCPVSCIVTRWRIAFFMTLSLHGRDRVLSGASPSLDSFPPFLPISPRRTPLKTGFKMDIFSQEMRMAACHIDIDLNATPYPAPP